MLKDIKNPYVEALRTARDRFDTNQDEKFKMKIICNREKDARTYNLPTANEVAALIPDDFPADVDKRDIVVQYKSGKLLRINETHPSYLALQYPLLFPLGEDGFKVGIEKGMTSNPAKRKNKKGTISMRQFFAFRIMERKCEQHHLLLSKRLFQQFLVDSFTTIESNRLSYIRQHQSDLRSANFEDIKDATELGKSNLQDEGKRVFLPSSFTGGPRYMQQHYLDAMAICKHFGFPDLFITFTCNPKWPEITRYLESRNLKSDDRPDITCRVFKMKLESLMKDLTVDGILGKTVSAMYTIEFQKRGLPHAHILLFMHQKYKLPSPEDIDRIICAEIPDKMKDPELYNVVKDMMIHGPCGRMNRNSPCMVDGRCTKYFPKAYTERTTVDKDGYPVYRRRKSDHFVEKYNYKLDNRYVVPYNRELSIRYRAHINVEWCNQAGSIKYLFKYIHKGTDKILAKVVPVKDGEETTTSNPKNEVKDYLTCRYVSACEAAWRILEFPITYRSTPVEKLAMHLPGKQNVVFKENEPADKVLNRSSIQKSQLQAYFDINNKDPVARDLTYVQIPNKFTYNKQNKEFCTRKRRFSIGRINYVPRKITETYHLRMLLNSVTGKKSFDDLKTVDGVTFGTYKEACCAKGLLKDDKEYIGAITDANFWADGFFCGNYLLLCFYPIH